MNIWVKFWDQEYMDDNFFLHEEHYYLSPEDIEYNKRSPVYEYLPQDLVGRTFQTNKESLEWCEEFVEKFFSIEEYPEMYV